MSSCSQILKLAKEALSASNARAYDGDPNYVYMVKVETCVTGLFESNPGGITLRASIPRSVNNPLAFSQEWVAGSRKEGAAFLRALADLVDRAPESLGDGQ